MLRVECHEPHRIERTILVATPWDLWLLAGMIKLLQKFSKPGGILPNNIDKKYSCEGKKKNGQVQYKNDNANQNPLFFTHDCLTRARYLLGLT